MLTTTWRTCSSSGLPPPLPHQDTWPSPHTPDGALWGHFTTEWVISGYGCFLRLHRVMLQSGTQHNNLCTHFPVGMLLAAKGYWIVLHEALALTYYGIWSHVLDFPEPSFIQLQVGSNSDAKITSHLKIKTPLWLLVRAKVLDDLLVPQETIRQANVVSQTQSWL